MLVTSKVQFKPIELSMREIIEPRMQQSGFMGCEYTFGCTYIWSPRYDIKVAEIAGYTVLREDNHGYISYLYPVGSGDIKQVINALVEHASEQGDTFTLHGVEESAKQQLEQLFPGRFSYTPYRDGFDYIYGTEDLANLRGKKFHSKRNHISFFEREGDWQFEPITDENTPDVIEMHRQWCKELGCYEDESLTADMHAARIGLTHREKLGLEGGAIRKNGDIVAFSLGERINDEVYCVHIEKAFAQIRGAYPIINREFVRHFCENYKYVNREDDVGDEGLRKAKLSYRPQIILEKYEVTLKGDA